MSMNTDLSNVALFELHDARIGSVVLHPGGTVQVHLAHASVFFKKATDLYEVWSCEADLCLDAVEQMQLNRSMRADDYVSEAKFYDLADHDVDPVDLLDRGGSSAARRLVMLFGSGASISICFGSAKLGMLVPKKRLEEWSGPL
jgi:hypothetical protein